MSSLCMAMKLQDAGIESYTVYDLASDVGGTLRDNTYGRTPSRLEPRSRPISNASAMSVGSARISGSTPRWTRR
jgi:cation diffusion facilitator CzcD-associated flavoprotein CzcO